MLSAKSNGKTTSIMTFDDLKWKTVVNNNYGLNVYAMKIGELIVLHVQGNLEGHVTKHTITLPIEYKAQNYSTSNLFASGDKNKMVYIEYSSNTLTLDASKYGSSLSQGDYIDALMLIQ